MIILDQTLNSYLCLKCEYNYISCICRNSITSQIIFQIANALGLSGVSYDIITTSDLDQRMAKVSIYPKNSTSFHFDLKVLY